MNPRRRESTYAGHALHLRARCAQNVAMAIRLPCLLLLPLLATSGAPAQESDITIYRCTGAAGHLTVQDSPCADDQPQPRSAEPKLELQSLMRTSNAALCLTKT